MGAKVGPVEGDCWKDGQSVYHSLDDSKRNHAKHLILSGIDGFTYLAAKPPNSKL
jgi:hypothetical protein